jgi:hypothetical protein
MICVSFVALPSDRPNQPGGNRAAGLANKKGASRMSDIAKDEWGRLVRVTGFRAGYLVCEQINKYGDFSGGMVMYSQSELRPAKLAKRPCKKAAKRRSKAKK